MIGVDMEFENAAHGVCIEYGDGNEELFVLIAAALHKAHAAGAAAERSHLVHLADHKHSIADQGPCKPCAEWQRIKHEANDTPCRA